MPMRIQTLSDFINAMNETIWFRRPLVKKFVTSREVDLEMLDQLSQTQGLLEQIPNQNGNKLLQLGDSGPITLDVNYELEELKKDIWFFKNGEERFNEHLQSIHSNYIDEVAQGMDFLKGIRFLNFISDRDGTVNNYCGRYSTSIQSAYNSVFLCRYAASSVKNAVILTSAPLEGPGLIDISVNPDNIFIYAGSKGREYADKAGRKGNFPIEDDKQKMIEKLNSRLSNLVRQEAYSDFSRIGSGLQFKFGQTAIARQDINKSIDEQRSEEFLATIKELVNELDPENDYFRIEDTGLDIEIILTVKDDESGQARDFDKGDGISFLDESLQLGLKDGPNLICGDTNSDVSMVETAMKKSEQTRAIFVTEDKELKNRVRSVCPNTLFVSEPDILISILNKIALA